jgi:outer membrane cobalamin receptor
VISVVLLISLIGQPVYEVDELLVTATRYPAALKDVALATTVIDKDEIEKVRPLSVGEILQTHAGLDIKDYGIPGASSSLSIRGIQSNGILVLINGHPLNWVTTGTADLNSIDVDAVERIEVVKGPVSSLYGANALGGVVNIITTRDYETPEFQIKLSPSTTDFDEPLQRKEIFLNAGLPIGKTDIGCAMAYEASNGFRSNSDLTRYHVQANVAHDLDYLEVSSTVTCDDKEYGVPGPVPLIDSIHPIPPLGDSTATSLFDRQKDRHILGDIRSTWHASENVSLHNTLFADRKLLQFHTRYLDFYTGDTVVEDYDYLVHTLGLNTMAAITLERNEIVLGVDIHYDTLEITRASQETGDTLWNASSYTIGGWFEWKKNLTAITLNPSIRFDWNSKFGNFLSPQFGVVSSPLPNFFVKVSIGKAFRAPTFNDLYWPIFGNPDLKPEHGWAYEVRLEGSPRYNLFVALSLFMRNIRDRIFWLPAENGLWQPQNVNYLSVKGLDIELHSQINEFINIYLEGTFLHARQKNNEITYDYYDWMADTSLTVIEEIERNAAFTPDYTISSKINFILPHEFAINLTGSYVAARVNYYPNYEDYPNVTMDEKRLDDYVLVSISASKKVVKYLALSIGIKNFFNTEYTSQFGNMIDDRDYPMPGRTFFAQLIWQKK